MSENTTSSHRGGIWKGLLIVLIVFAVICLLCVLSVALPVVGFFGAAFFKPTKTPYIVNSQNAKQEFAIKQLDNGQVVMNTPRYLGLDQKGQIYAGDFDDGKVNVFDPSGKFLHAFTFGTDVTLNGMAVAPDGTVYLSYKGSLHRLDAQGRITDFETSTHTEPLEAVILDKDGSLLVTDQPGNILRLGQNGTVSQVMKTPLGGGINNADDSIFLALDGAGNIYAFVQDSALILKLSPDGKSLAQFGGKTHNHIMHHVNQPDGVPALDPGYFYSPDAIAVDGNGRIFASDDTGNVQILDLNGKYIDSFESYDNVAAMMVDPANKLYIATDRPQIVKLTVK